MKEYHMSDLLAAYDGLSAEFVVLRFVAGDSIADIAANYDQEADFIENAIRREINHLVKLKSPL
jgi:uncharacterized protein (DUF433 family)